MSAFRRAYKTELDLNNEQTTARRPRRQEAYRATGTSPSAMELHRELNALKQTVVSWKS
jgi:hypothetical protein